MIGSYIWRGQRHAQNIVLDVLFTTLCRLVNQSCLSIGRLNQLCKFLRLHFLTFHYVYSERITVSHEGDVVICPLTRQVYHTEAVVNCILMSIANLIHATVVYSQSQVQGLFKTLMKF